MKSRLDLWDRFGPGIRYEVNWPRFIGVTGRRSPEFPEAEQARDSIPDRVDPTNVAR